MNKKSTILFLIMSVVGITAITWLIMGLEQALAIPLSRRAMIPKSSNPSPAFNRLRQLDTRRLLDQPNANDTHALAMGFNNVNHETLLADVVLSGPVESFIGAPCTFTATINLPTISSPATYVWQAVGQTPISSTANLSHTAIFTWHVPGPQVVTVTVTKAGHQVIATHAITINTLLNGVSLSGSRTGKVNIPYTFVAAVSPVTVLAALPITYVWQATGYDAPIIHSNGYFSDTFTSTWNIVGLKTVTVTADNGIDPPWIDAHTIDVEAYRLHLPLILHNYPPNIYIAMLEVTQDTQTYNPDNILIEGRSTMVRVFLGTEHHSHPPTNISGRLYGHRDGVALSDSPLSPDNAPFTVPLEINRNNPNHTLNFTLPSDWTSGDLHLVFELIPDGADNVGDNRHPAIGDLIFTFHVPNIYPTNLELTQAVQTPRRSVTLIQERPALVRVFLATQYYDTSPNNVSGLLYGYRDDVALPDSPLSPVNAPFTVPSTINRGNLNHTLNFYPPSSWLSGNIQLFFQLNSETPDEIEDNRYPLYGRLNFAFRDVSPMEIVIVPIAYHHNGKVYRPNTDYTTLTSWTYRAFPLNTPLIVHTHAEYHFSDDLSRDDAWRDLLKLITNLRNTERPNSNVHYYGLIPRNSDKYQLLWGGKAWCPDINSARKYLVAVGIDQLSNEAGGRTMGHELGHNMGRKHVDCGNPDHIDPYYPFSGGIIGHWGYDISTGTIWPPETAYDFMSYCNPEWISKYNYEAIYARRRTLVPAQVSWERDPSSQKPQPVIQVSGWIKGDQGHLNPAYRITAPAVNSESWGIYRLDLIDVAGNTRYRYHFTPQLISSGPDGTYGFALNLPDVTGTVAIRLWADDQLLDELRPGKSTPTLRDVNQVYQTALDGGTDTLALIWHATDPDDDRLYYATRYSRDNGTTWQTMAQDLTSPHIDFDSAALPGGPGLLQVLASDGLHTSQVVLEPISLTDKPPQVGIIMPVMGMVYRSNQPLTLAGMGSDLEDGALPDGAFNWISSEDGLLGVGRVLYLDQGLSPGRHVLTLTVYDTVEQTASQTVEITIAPQVHTK